MPNASSIQAIAQGILIQTVGSGRTAGDLFILPVVFRTAFNAGLQALEDTDDVTALTESNRAGGSGKAREAITRLNELLHDGYNGITAIRSSKITEAERLEVYTGYGWSGGLLGRFNDARILGLARLSVDAELDIEKPEWEYPADLKGEIAEQLAIFDANADDRTGGERMQAVKLRDEALETFQILLSRVRYYLCFASNDTDQSPELRRYGFKVRKDRTSAKAVVQPVTPSP